MISFKHSVSILCLAATCVVSAHAQKSALAVSDDGWSSLKDSGHRAVEKNQIVSWTGQAGVSTAPVVADYLARADALKDFRAAHAGDPRLGEARRIEAIMLVWAGFYGDSANLKRCADLVVQVRSDQTLPAADRFALASLSAYQPLRLQSFFSVDARLFKYEQTARALITEFPDTKSAYEAYLCIAKASGETQSARIANDLLVLPSPTAVKASAQDILDRQKLIGQSLKKIFASALSPENRPSLPNNIVLVYPWSAANEGSLVNALEAASEAPSGTAIFGVNLDTDLVTARQVAADRKLPGQQFYDRAGLSSRLAQALKLAGDNVVLIADRQGYIQFVSCRPNLAPKFAAAR